MQVAIKERENFVTSVMKNEMLYNDTVETQKGIIVYNIATRPNSVYHVSVGTEALDICKTIPTKWSPKVLGCRTDYGSMLEIPMRLMRFFEGLSANKNVFNVFF